MRPHIPHRICRGILLVMSLCQLAPVATAATHARRVDTAEFGQVLLYAPEGRAQQFAFIFSGNDGVSNEDLEAAQRLAESAVVVAVIDTRESLPRLNALDEDCIDLPGPLEWLSRNAEHDLQFPGYREPVLLGRGSGGTLVYAALAQAPALSFAGGMSVDFSRRIALAKPLCRLPAASGDGGRILSADYPLRGWWRVGASTAMNEEMLAFAKTSAAANHRDPEPPLGPAPVASLYSAAISATAAGQSTADAAVLDLPLVAVSAQPASATLVILYTGDGGWRDLDKTIGETLAAKGLAVVGVDTLRYFWSQRSPEETARDLERVITHYLDLWQCRQVVLIGYSFGADVLPFAYNRLSPQHRRLITRLSLLAPGREADFEVHLEGWLGIDTHSDSVPIAPEVRKIEHDKLQCIYGDDDADKSLCVDEVMKGAEVIRTAGGHHFDEDYGALADRIINAIAQRRPQAQTRD